MTSKQLAKSAAQIAPYIVKIQNDGTAGSGAKALVVRYNLEKLAKKSHSRFEELKEDGKGNDNRFRISDPLCRELELAGMNE